MFSVFKYDGDTYERVFDDGELIHAELYAANHSKYESAVFSVYNTTEVPTFVCYYENGKRFDETDDDSMTQE